MAQLEFKFRKHIAPAVRGTGFDLDVTLECDAGITVLFGPSGSGKTLSLDSLAGFLKPDEEGFEPIGMVSSPSRTIASEPSDDDNEELGPVAKALLEALKGSGRDLLPHEDDDDEEAEDKDK